MTEASPDISSLFIRDNKINYCNIELRENGIIIRFRTIQETYAWVIPYYKMNLYQIGNQLTLYTDDRFIKLEPAYNAILNGRFISKILKFKSLALSNAIHTW